MSLKDQIATDLDEVFFNERDFAVVCTYTPRVGASYSVNGLFDAEYVAVDPLSGTDIQSVRPRLVINDADLSTTPTAGDRVTVNSVVYTVQERKPQGFGTSELFLWKV